MNVPEYISTSLCTEIPKDIFGKLVSMMFKFLANFLGGDLLSFYELLYIVSEILVK